MNDKIEVTLTRDQALVLLDWLTREDSEERIPTEDAAERRVLWIVEGQLEKLLLEQFDPNYATLVKAARERVAAAPI